VADDEDAVAQAVDELYSAEPDSFLERRSALSAAAKRSGDPAGAKQIAALRKPTRSAFAVNLLARTDPDAVAELLDLGSQLRDAERSVDAKQIRELTTRRRRLIDELTKRAFDILDERAPSSAIRDEVVSTLTAALADSDVADQVADGTLVKPARWEGFGFGGGPDLSLVPSPATERAAKAKPAPAPKAPARKGMSKEEAAEARRVAAEQEAEARAQAKAAAEAAKQEKLDDARRAVDEAEEAVILATDEEQTRLERLQRLEEQVADARKGVDDARIQLRRAEIRQRRAQDALRRLER
jgi:hypothetical protein